MSLSEQTIIETVEVSEKGTVFVQKTTQILKDGAVFATTNNRTGFPPGHNVTQEDAKVQDIWGVVWTPEVVNAYRASLPS